MTAPESPVHVSSLIITFAKIRPVRRPEKDHKLRTSSTLYSKNTGKVSGKQEYL